MVLIVWAGPKRRLLELPQPDAAKRSPAGPVDLVKVVYQSCRLIRRPPRLSVSVYPTIGSAINLKQMRIVGLSV